MGIVRNWFTSQNKTSSVPQDLRQFKPLASARGGVGHVVLLWLYVIRRVYATILAFLPVVAPGLRLRFDRSLDILIRKTEEIVQIFKVLLVIHPTVVMMLLVTGRSAEYLRKESMRHPRQVVPAVCLAEQIRHDEIVQQSREDVLMAKAAER